MNILFVTWDGPQSSYLEGLFLPIFKKLNEVGFHFHVLQFTWADKTIISTRKKASLEAGCSYESISILRKPVALGSLFTAITGCRHIRKAILKNNIDMVLPRSNLPALSTLLALRGLKTKFVFDSDGLALDERVDFAGLSPSGPIYRLLRDIEAQAVRRADTVLVRSTKAADILLARAGAGTSQEKFYAVTNGRDMSLFNPGTQDTRASTRESLGIEINVPLLVYAGSIGPQYCVTAMLHLFELVLEKQPTAHFLILTGSPEIIHQELENWSHLIESITIKSFAANEVPAYLACADLGLAFRKTSFSMQGVAPIKLGEYLLCGLPLVATNGIGDTDSIDKKAGFLLEFLDEHELRSVANWFVDQVLPYRASLREHCREIGEANFSLQASADSYHRALSHISMD
ncbi:glycosyltransferase [Parahaliea sp. F7430]|uniref:Glycosyltransferase n=1 Tax=Sediminihaliea albiluteola TaxID=2758564 RepID=A0A7W2TUN6_9GAMM|nr:glycosyltransferase [Sediminihaliea albiluteola]MBA6412290.1 glycosyltransferase [Sediminihaliea albiluteola]